MEDTYNYRPLFRHSYTFRGTVAKKYGGFTYAFSVETFFVILISFLINLPFVYLVWKVNSNYLFATLLIPPFVAYKLYDTINPDGLKVHQYVWQYLKYYVKFYLPNRTLSHDKPVFYTESEVVIK
ncbi:hypothetical protein JOC36_000927 [Weissella uvarum]|uniref:TcpE family conjugal transfer membrane protein n=1 Tax=Weissella uvarum TaxID=1479233 RepID=UPI001960B926|nr:TcpE family conjugal transfer membrane protein [Weissella uvarum]MBM7617370.1 hypothetical protein [Weissella uvarum]MCM0595744.1 hypothetical protein [Weissella uvarum]